MDIIKTIEAAQTRDDIDQFKIGDTIKNRLQVSMVWMLVGNEYLWKSIGLKATVKIPLLNGMIDSRLLSFESYQGSRSSATGQKSTPNVEEKE